MTETDGYDRPVSDYTTLDCGKVLTNQRADLATFLEINGINIELHNKISKMNF